MTDLAGLIAHSDAGSQYTSIALTSRMLEAGIDPSVGSVGDALDNALAETTIGSFKIEQIHRHGPWRDLAKGEVTAFEWVDFFNTDRPHEYSTTGPSAKPRNSTTLTNTPAPDRVRHRTGSPDIAGRLNPAANGVLVHPSTSRADRAPDRRSHHLQ